MRNGIINIYKEKGFTSHDVVAKLRGIFHQKKIGHTGTLDPDAEGVLPVCLGKGTKLCDMITDKDKTYQAKLLLGITTDTQDTSGTIQTDDSNRILKEYQQGNLTDEIITKAILSFVGEYDQVPPMYSALKVNGKKLYELARQGKEIERKARRVNIFEIKVDAIEFPYVTMTVSCSKGTYIRTLCDDIGKLLGTGGCMSSLVRTKVGRFDIAHALTLQQVEEQLERIDDYIIPVDLMFSYTKVIVADTFSKLIYNGNPFRKEHIKYVQKEAEIQKQYLFSPQEQVKVYDEAKNFIGIYQYCEKESCFKIVKMFLDR